MPHTLRNKDKLVARVRRIKGQLEGVERALLADTPCGEVLRQLASARGALAGMTAELMEDHLREHVLGAEDAAARNAGGEELIEVFRTYLK